MEPIVVYINLTETEAENYSKLLITLLNRIKKPYNILNYNILIFIIKVWTGHL